MAELTHKERLQPSLLDRLTDDEPDKEQESRSKRVLSPSKLRESVRRDLAWLLNTTNLAALQPEVDSYPQVVESVLNYGLPDLSGRVVSSIDVPALERVLRKAILDFEPRLVRNSVRVRVQSHSDDGHNTMSFVIEGVLWAQPMPLRMFLKTEIDLETGEAAVTEVGES